MIAPDAKAVMQARIAAVKARVDVSVVVGRAVKLTRRGNEFSGLCPFHQERSASFTVNNAKQFAHCFGCGWHGDVIRFVMEHDGVDFAEAVARLEAGAGIDPRRPGPAPVSATPRAAPESALVDGARAAAWVWAQGETARGTGLGEAWLRHRRIDPAANGLLDVVRLVRDCPAALWRRDADPADVRRRAPALVAPILRVSGGPGERALALSGVHLTFLQADGAGKARFAPWRSRETGQLVTPPTRMMWGAAARGAVPIPAAPRGAHDPAALAEWICGLIDGPGELVVGEGLESTQSLLADRPGARMAWATLSLGNMEGVPVRVGQRAALPMWNLRADPELGRPFTLRKAGRVVLAVDADMKPTQPLWVQDVQGGPVIKRALTGLERSSKCAALASSAWLQAGAERVKVVRPPAGADFNDGEL